MSMTPMSSSMIKTLALILLSFGGFPKFGQDNLSAQVRGESKAASKPKLFPSPAKLPFSSHFLTTEPLKYSDGRPGARYRLEALDSGRVLKHGGGPSQCDTLGARDVWVWESDGTYFMHYDGAGSNGWLACLATSLDLTNWVTRGAILDFGGPDEEDWKSASYGSTFSDGKVWHMFYMGTRHVSRAPDLIPATPYMTMKARSQSPFGPWYKQREVVPFRCQAKTYYSDTASPGHIVKERDEFLMFFSAATQREGRLLRTLGIARTKNLDGPWAVAGHPIVPLSEQIENSSLYFESSNQTWFLFSNHVGIENGDEFTDAVWVYWSKDLSDWNAEDKAVVLDGKNCSWSRKCIGLPSVVKVGQRLAILYDGPGEQSTSHMRRDVGLAWLNLPLSAPNKSR